MLMNVGQVVLGRGRHVQRPYYAGWEGALPRGPLPYTRRGDITGNGEGTCCPPVQHLDRKRSPSPAPSSDPLSHWKIFLRYLERASGLDAQSPGSFSDVLGYLKYLDKF